VGKTSLLRRIAQDPALAATVISGSAILQQVIAPSTLEEFDEWEPEVRAAARESAIRKLTEERQNTPCRLLMDGHFTLRDRRTGRVEPVFTARDRSFYDALVLVEGTPEEILSRRRTDSRTRPAESVPNIAEHLGAERAEGLRLAQRMGVPILVIAAKDQRRGAAIVEEFLNRMAPHGGMP
jgi:adenylate kinase